MSANIHIHLLKVSLVRLSQAFKGRGLDARIVACVHDSIWVEAILGEEAVVREILEQVMTTVCFFS